MVADNLANASRTTLFDVVVVHPSISSFKLSYDRAGAAAADRSQRKNKKYKDLAESLDYLFTDFAVETYGRMSDAARKVVKQLGDMYEQLHGGDDSDGYIPRSVFVDHCRQVLGIALQRAICTQISNNVGSTQRRRLHTRRCGSLLKSTSHRTPLGCGIEGSLNVKCVNM